MKKKGIDLELRSTRVDQEQVWKYEEKIEQENPNNLVHTINFIYVWINRCWILFYSL